MARKNITVISAEEPSDRVCAALKALSLSYNINLVAFGDWKNACKDLDISAKIFHVHTPYRLFKTPFDFFGVLQKLIVSFLLIRKANRIMSNAVIVFTTSSVMTVFASRFLKPKSVPEPKKMIDLALIPWCIYRVRKKTGKYFWNKWVEFMNLRLSRFDRVIVSNESEKTWLNYQTSGKIMAEVIPEGIYSGHLKQLKRTHPFKKELFHITWISNLGSFPNFYSLMETMKEMKGIHLHIVASPHDAHRINQYLTVRQNRNVTVWESLTFRQRLRHYGTSDLLLAMQDVKFEKTIPPIIYEYLATRLPVVFYGSGAAADFLRTFNNTFRLHEINSRMLENCIQKTKQRLAANPAGNAEVIGTHFIREKLCIRYTEIISGLLNKKSLSKTFVEEILLNAERE